MQLVIIKMQHDDYKNEMYCNFFEMYSFSNEDMIRMTYKKFKKDN